MVYPASVLPQRLRLKYKAVTHSRAHSKPSCMVLAPDSVMNKPVHQHNGKLHFNWPLSKSENSRRTLFQNEAGKSSLKQALKSNL